MLLHVVCRAARLLPPDCTDCSMVCTNYMCLGQNFACNIVSSQLNGQLQEDDGSPNRVAR